MTGIDELRRAVTLLGNCTETFNQQFSAEQLIAIYRGYSACGWDITPDRWTAEQVDAALRGIIPEFDGPPTKVSDGGRR